MPYNSMMWTDDEGTPTYIDIQTEAFKKNPLVPIHYFNSNSAYTCPTVLFRVRSDSINGFSDNEVNKVKQLLASGVVLSGQMDTSVGSSSEQNSF